MPVTESQDIQDDKLKQFLQLSLDTRHIRHASSVLYVLLSNTVDEIGIKLGVMPRRKEERESLSAYVELINRIFEVNFEVTIFPESAPTRIKAVELLFERKLPHEEFPTLHLKTLTELYFELRALKLPNLKDHLKTTDIMDNRTVSFMSFLGRRGAINGSDSSSPIKTLLLHRLRQDQEQVRARLRAGMDQEQFIKLVQLKSLENSLLAKSKKKKVIISGDLSSAIKDSGMTSNAGKYALLGILFAFAMLGIACVAEMVMIGFVTAEIGSMVLLSAIMVLILYYLIKKGFTH